MDNLKLEEMDIFRLPTFPAPWISADGGEVFVADEYLFVFQKHPVTIREHMEKLKYGKCRFPSGLFYLYAMPVFHKISHDNMFKPVMAITLERSDQTELLQKLEDDDEYKELLLQNGGLSPVMFCMFIAHRHANFGLYSGGLDPESVKKVFFAKAREITGFNEKPEKIGTIREVLERVKVD